MKKPTLISALESMRPFAAGSPSYSMSMSTIINVYHHTIIENVVKTSEKSAEGIRKGIALAELISYMEGQHIEGKKVFKLSDLVVMYTDRLNELGVDQVGRVHTTQLKNRILASVPDIEPQNIGRNVFLTFKEEIGQLLQKYIFRRPR